MRVIICKSGPNLMNSVTVRAHQKPLLTAADFSLLTVSVFHGRVSFCNKIPSECACVWPKLFLDGCPRSANSVPFKLRITGGPNLSLSRILVVEKNLRGNFVFSKYFSGRRIKPWRLCRQPQRRLIRRTNTILYIGQQRICAKKAVELVEKFFSNRSGADKHAYSMK